MNRDPVEGMLSAEELDEFRNCNNLGPEAYNWRMEKLLLSHHACERALRDSRNLLREAEARADEWKRVANEREGALRDAQARLEVESAKRQMANRYGDNFERIKNGWKQCLDNLVAEFGDGIEIDVQIYQAETYPVDAVGIILYRMKKRITALEKALQAIAFHLPTVEMSNDNKQFTDVEEVFKLKRMAAEAAPEPPQAGGEEKPE